jgi:hypothetical protein
MSYTFHLHAPHSVELDTPVTTRRIECWAPDYSFRLVILPGWPVHKPSNLPDDGRWAVNLDPEVRDGQELEELLIGPFAGAPGPVWDSVRSDLETLYFWAEGPVRPENEFWDGVRERMEAREA